MTKSTKDLLETMEKSSNYRDYLKENKDHLEKNFMKVDRGTLRPASGTAGKKSGCNCPGRN